MREQQDQPRCSVLPTIHDGVEIHFEDEESINEPPPPPSSGTTLTSILTPEMDRKTQKSPDSKNNNPKSPSNSSTLKKPKATTRSKGVAQPGAFFQVCSDVEAGGQSSSNTNSRERTVNFAADDNTTLGRYSEWSIEGVTVATRPSVHDAGESVTIGDATVSSLATTRRNPSISSLTMSIQSYIGRKREIMEGHPVNEEIPSNIETSGDEVDQFAHLRHGAPRDPARSGPVHSRPAEGFVIATAVLDEDDRKGKRFCTPFRDRRVLALLVVAVVAIVALTIALVMKSKDAGNSNIDEAARAPSTTGKEQQPKNSTGLVIDMDPFHVEMVTSEPANAIDEKAIARTAEDHVASIMKELIESFESVAFDVMLVDDGVRRDLRRRQKEEFVVTATLNGVVRLKNDAKNIPDSSTINAAVTESFSENRIKEFVSSLQASGIEVESALVSDVLGNVIGVSSESNSPTQASFSTPSQSPLVNHPSPSPSIDVGENRADPPTNVVTGSPSPFPSTGAPSRQPVGPGADQPTKAPGTRQPIPIKSAFPTITPTLHSSIAPTEQPSTPPSRFPTASETFEKTPQPTEVPTFIFPTTAPTLHPSLFPTVAPSRPPSRPPTASKITQLPTYETSSQPTEAPVFSTQIPTDFPSTFPTKQPSKNPTTSEPTKMPTPSPTLRTTDTPTDVPTASPVEDPTPFPTPTPSKQPISTAAPTTLPTELPTTSEPTERPIPTPTHHPTGTPTSAPVEDPTVFPTQTPLKQPPATADPTTHPTTRPTPSPKPAVAVLVTKLNGSQNRDGAMFDVVAKESSITITALDVHIASTESNIELEVWTKSGSYVGFERTSSAWTMRNRGSPYIISKGRGRGQLSQVSEEEFESIIVPAGETLGFYVTLKGDNNMVVTQSNSDITTEDNHVRIVAGASKKYLFGATNSPRIWNGAIKYVLT